MIKLNKMDLPSDLHRIHLMGICGTGMASLAGMLQEQGYTVTGSDQNIYPPMSRFLQALSIPVNQGYRPDNLCPKPDLVIVGNVISRYNPEAIELARLGLPYLSLPQALKRFALKGKQSIVISGAHGKTTTSSLAAWILEKAGMDPGFMIGGIRHYDHCDYKGHRYDYHGHWRSWDEWDKYARKNPRIYKKGRYYREDAHLMFRFCDPFTGSCVFFSIGR